MNKLVIPAILVSITLVAGVFAFMPVEKASTVHTTIATNVDDQDRALFFSINGTGRADVTGFDLIPAVANKDLQGSVVVSASGNLRSLDNINCGLSSTDGTTTIANATGGIPGNALINTAGAGIPAGFVTGEGIELSMSVVGAGGICTVTILLDSGDE